MVGQSLGSRAFQVKERARELGPTGYWCIYWTDLLKLSRKPPKGLNGRTTVAVDSATA
jgi:hypothetical protein